MIANDKNQTPLLLDRQLVLSLVEQFAATGKPACTPYQPEKLAEAFAALPVVHRDPYSGAEFVDYHAAQRVIDQYVVAIIDRLAPKPAQCVAWSGPGGVCATCRVAAYTHPNAPTPESRGCTNFRCEGPTGRGLGDATWCDFCQLPAKDHKTGRKGKR